MNRTGAHLIGCAPVSFGAEAVADSKTGIRHDA
jgi:hypothetical protein